MDLVTAKTLVSALTVLAIVGFSLISFEAAFRSVASDLKAAWAGRTDANGADEPVTPSAAS